MNPIRAQRTWNALSTKWINAVPYGNFKGFRTRKPKPRRKIKKGILSNLIPVEVVNAITGEVAKGYMRDLSIKRLRRWLEFHNHKAQVEQVRLSNKSTFFHLPPEEFENYPILIKLGAYQVPYLIDHASPSLVVRGSRVVRFDLKTADNLKYLEIIAERKERVLNLFNKIKRRNKRTTKKKKR